MRASCRHLRPFRGRLRTFWGVFGGLGRSWVRLGRLLGHLGHPWVDFLVLSSLGRAEARNLGSKRGPRWSQKSTPNRPKSKTKTMRKTSRSRRPSWSDLGGILGRSWATPISKIVLSPRAGLVFLKIQVFEKIRCQEATWAEVRRKWGPRGSQNGA